MDSLGVKDGKPIVGSIWELPRIDGSPGNLFRIEGNSNSGGTSLRIVYDLKLQSFGGHYFEQTSNIVNQWKLYSLPEEPMMASKPIPDLRGRQWRMRNGCGCELYRVSDEIVVLACDPDCTCHVCEFYLGSLDKKSRVTHKQYEESHSPSEVKVERKDGCICIFGRSRFCVAHEE